MENPSARQIIQWILGGMFACIFFVWSPTVTHAATMYLSPSSGSYTVGDTVSTSVYVDTQSQAVNNAGATIHFPTSLLEVVSISKSGSVLSLWVEEPAFSNSAGTVSFDGGVPTPGYNGSAGKVITIVFKLKEAGLASLTCSSAAVRANDGLGTDVLRACGKATFTVAQKTTPPPVDEPETETTPPPVDEPETGAPAAPTISSSTHADQTKWYSDNNPVFSWALPTGTTGVNILSDQNPTTDPGTRSDGKFYSYRYDDVDEGNWFFHIRLQNANGWGPVSHFAFNIDKTAPTVPAILLTQAPSAEHPQGAIMITSEDTLSGVAYFIVTVDGVELAPVSPTDITPDQPYLLPIPTTESQIISVVAYDQAGNASEAGTLSYIIPESSTVQGAGFLSIPKDTASQDTTHNTLGPWAVNPWINFWGMLILLTCILILITLCIWLWRTRGLYHHVDSVEKRTAMRLMEHTLSDLEKQLRRLEHTHAKRPLTDEETAVYRAIRDQSNEFASSIRTLKGHTSETPILKEPHTKTVTRRSKK